MQRRSRLRRTRVRRVVRRQSWEANAPVVGRVTVVASTSAAVVNRRVQPFAPLYRVLDPVALAVEPLNSASP